MLKNFLKIAFRNMFRHKIFSLINLSGLAIGLFCFILIFLWVQDENSYEKTFDNYGNIYRLVGNAELSDKIFKAVVTPGEFAPYLKDQIPEIEKFTRYRPHSSEELIKVDEQNYYEKKVAFADSSFFEIFSFSVISGNLSGALADPYSAVITRSIAEKYFGDTDPIGKTFAVFDGRLQSVISAVIEDLPNNTHFEFDILLPMLLMAPFDWGNHYFNAYFSLHPEADPEVVNSKIDAAILAKELDHKATYYLQPIADIHLRSDFDIDMNNTTSEINNNVYIFTYIAIFVLLIACINFMNLSTARGASRAKEVGIRKVIGATKKNLILQFLGESLIFSFLAMLLSLMMIELFLPTFNNITGKNIVFLVSGNSLMLLGLVFVVFVTGLIAGSYPAYFLSAYNPIKALKGITGRKSAFIRRALVIFQFTLAIILISGTLIVFSQLKYIQSRDIGFDEENLVYLRYKDVIAENFDSVKEAWLKDPGILGVSKSSDIPTNTIHLWSGFEWEESSDESNSMMNFYTVDTDFINTVGFEIIDGRTFQQTENDKSNYIINESAAAFLGWEDPVGKWFSFNGVKGYIIGLVKDFNYKSIHTQVEPLVIRIGDYNQFIIVRLAKGDVVASLNKMEKIWDKFNPDYQFDAHFIDKEIEKLYINELRTGKIFSYFTFLTILVSCLGLFGLATFIIEQRTKEIGIRKVLGSSVNALVLLLSKDFTKWIIISNIIAIPVSWYLMQKWLQNFAYQIKITAEFFIISFAVSLLIALLTISLRTIRSANANPVDALKYE